MKILLVGFKLSVGIELYLLMLVKHLRGLGHEISICGDGSVVAGLPDGTPIANGGGTVQMVRDTLNPAHYISFARELERRAPEVVFFVSSHTLNIGAILLARLYSRKAVVVSQVHDPLPHSGAGYGVVILLSQLLQSWFSDQIIVAGAQLRELVHRYYAIPLTRIHVLPLGAHRQEMDTEDRSDRLYIPVLGRIEDYKGIEVFLEAAAAVCARMEGSRVPFKFLIAGAGDLNKYSAGIARVPPDRLEIRNQRISDTEFDEILANSHVCVLPYLDGTQTGTTQIAYYNHCPVIVTRVGSLAELVEEGRTGFIIAPNQPGELADRLVELLSDPARCRVLQSECHHYYREHLRWSCIILKLQDLILAWARR